MKKIAIIIAVFLILTAVLAGCGGAQNKESQNLSNTGPNQTASLGPGRTAGNGQRKFDPPTLSGEVASIAGNEVTLKVIAMPKFQENMNRGQGQGGRTRPNSGGWMGAPNGGSPGGGSPGGGGQALQRMIKYTGERKTVIIPVGLPITTMVRTDTGREMKTVEFNKIKKGDILQIWYSDKTQETISRISLRPLTRGANQ